MKEITVKDCLELEEQFKKYCDTAEQHEIAKLTIVGLKLEDSLDKIKKADAVKDQKDARAMFRVVLGVMGRDFSDYKEEV